MGDPSGDGLVSGTDLEILLFNWGQGAAPSIEGLGSAVVPEPATSGVFVIGVRTLLRRRRLG